VDSTTAEGKLAGFVIASITTWASVLELGQPVMVSAVTLATCIAHGDSTQLLTADLGHVGVVRCAHEPLLSHAPMRTLRQNQQISHATYGT
jgi:hypothetical protein